MSESPPEALSLTRESRAWTISGYILLLVAIALLAFDVLCIVQLASIPEDQPDLDATALTSLFSLLGSIFAFVLIAKGFFMLQPNQAAAITLFGSYRGTDRESGLRWVWPWMSKTKVSLRANNLISE